VTDPTRFVTRHGRRIAVKTLDTGHHPKPRLKPFEAQFVKVPRWWVEALRHRCGSTHHLALVILAEAFKRKNIGGEVVLSSETTGMPRMTRARAARELVRLGLIEVRQEGNQAVKVTHIYYKK
jgi:hypothetical protein